MPQTGRRVKKSKPKNERIAPPRDNQEVMRMILEVIFEPTFSNNSQEKEDTALRQVYEIWCINRRGHIKMF